MTKKLPILSVVPTQSYHLRWYIEDEKGRVWTGVRFTTLHKNQKRLYLTRSEAAFDVQKLLRAYFKGAKKVRYVFPVIVDVLCNENLDPAEVAEYLSKAARLYLDVKNHGNGPKNSLVMSVIDWSRLQVVDAVE